MNASPIMLPNGQPAGGQGVAVTLVHDPGVMESVNNVAGGLARLHDVHLFTEAARRFAGDDADVYGGFEDATREVLNDLDAFHQEVARWGGEKREAMEAAMLAEQQAAEATAALDAQGDLETDDAAQAAADAELEVTA